MGLADRLGRAFVRRKCPAGRWHKINIDFTECGHTGKILDWCEEYHKWIPNPSKTDEALRMLKDDEEFAVDREAREMLEEALRDGNLKPALDYRRMILNR